MTVYLVLWIIFFLFSLIFILIHQKDYSILDKNYYAFIFEPWKFVTFLISGSVITLIGPYTNDPTWDHTNGTIMSITTYMTAPWAIAEIYFFIRKQTTLNHILPVLGVLLFSTSWSYDAYLLIRDGSYPNTWDSNLIVSTVIYICAGLMWNLEWTPDRGATFSFMKKKWPSRNTKTPFIRILLYTIPFMALAAYLTVSLFDRI